MHKLISESEHVLNFTLISMLSLFHRLEMPHCFAYGCTNHSGKLRSAVSMHSFPKELPLAEKWVHHSRTDVGNVKEFVQDTLMKNPGHYVLCSEHFEEDMFDLSSDSSLISSEPNHKWMRRKLKVNAVPTVFATGAPKLRKQAAYHLKIHERKQVILMAILFKVKL